ncbi:hypothetical protein NDU88_003027 [Pleurodeles waltl]|uniref:Uncharacterized protein n=1 Tax=Pleurodeles waltl TaxID=8319 RepID=A0AAV7SFG7_PLEWA|nr:hypothetical protein NDU88_003027 [Pleurodeles waltl]
MPPLESALSNYAPTCSSWRPLVCRSVVSSGLTARFNFSPRIRNAGLHHHLVACVDHSPRVPPDVWCRCFQLRVQEGA